jgi:Na+:H+ antiporter, NhaA family
VGEVPEGQREGLRFPWSRSERRVPRLVVRPLQAFLDTEAASGSLVLAGAVVALVWANSPWRDAYATVWETDLTVRLGQWAISHDLRHWVNDGLMAIFFFVVGLEIKREAVIGELRQPRAAAFPAIAALGGMVVPALLYLALNPGGDAARGWGIPMATDIAFAVGVLSLAGRRAPPSLKLFLLSLAIVDDIGAILVIALFYTAEVEAAALIVAAALLVLMVLMRRLEIRAQPLYVLLGIGVWLAVHASGVHATIAGVAVGFVTPAVPFQRPRAVSDEAVRVADETEDDPSPPDADAHHWLHLASLSREAVSPLTRMENLLHPWTSYVIVPLFALANAGIVLEADSLAEPGALRLAAGVAVGLVVGKMVGIAGAAWLAVKLGLARLPTGVDRRHVLSAAAVAGIGFTVSLFISELAFGRDDLRAAAKLGILIGSLLAGAVGTVLLRRASRPGPRASRRETIPP